jgi:hypothetical protein
MEMSNRYEECKLPESKSLKKRNIINASGEESTNPLFKLVDDVDDKPDSSQESSFNQNLEFKIPSKIQADPSIKECFKNVISAVKELFSALTRKTGCVALVSTLGYVLIGSVLIGYMATFVMFGINFGKYLLRNNTSSV